MNDFYISLESRQTRLNQQRQRIKDNMNKKHIQQIGSIKNNDNHKKMAPRFSLLKEEYDSKPNERNKFAYDGPQAFELVELESEGEDDIEVIHSGCVRSPLCLEAVVIRNNNTDESMESTSIGSFDYTTLVFDQSKEVGGADKEDLNTAKAKESSGTLSSHLQTSLESLTLAESGGNGQRDSFSGSLNSPEMAVSPCARAPPRDSPRHFPRDGAEVSSDVDSLKHNASNYEDSTRFLDDFIDINMEMETFIASPGPEKYIVRCHISRDKRGVDKGMFPIYYVHLERKDTKPLFLLAARRRKMSKTSNYIISRDATDLKRDGFGFLAKLRSNFVGTQFSLFDNGKNPGSKRDLLPKTSRKELVAVAYEPNVLGFKGPRKMTIIIPEVSGKGADSRQCHPQPEEGFMDRWKRNNMDGLLELHNKKPLWNEDSQSYVLNFHGRVTQASVKNFQIVADNDEERIVMQFGRTSDDSFSMDYSYPLSALQAFGIALSSFDGKLACE